MKITDYEILDHGYHHEQYFQGCGTCMTRWDECVTGMGDTPHEALEDALDQLAGMSDLELDDIVNDLSNDSHQNDDDDGNGDFHFYVSIRFMLPEGANGFR